MLQSKFDTKRTGNQNEKSETQQSEEMIRRTLCEVMEVGECKPTRNNGIAFSAKVGNSEYFVMDNDLQNGLLLEIVDRYGVDVSSLQSAEIAITTVRNAHDTNQRIEVWTVEFESFPGMKFFEIFQTNLSLLSKEEVPNFARIILATSDGNGKEIVLGILVSRGPRHNEGFR